VSPILSDGDGGYGDGHEYGDRRGDLDGDDQCEERDSD
jgi:hypothetical protein